MPDLPAYQDPRTALAAAGLRARKSMGQCFLVDRAKIDRLAEAAVPDASWSVVEIGAGTGALTLALARRAASVLAIEADPALAAHLDAFFVGTAGVRTTLADARGIDFGALPAGRPLAVAGNLPYHLTGALIERVLEARPAPDRVVFTVQLEVADRIAAGPGSRVYGALSVLTAAAWTPRRLFRIGRGSFHPAPNVDSAAVLFEPLERPLCSDSSRPAFRRLVLGVFSHRRKTLRNALGHAGFDPQAVAALADLPGIRLGDRPERHDVRAFVAMARHFESCNLPPAAPY